MNAKKSKDKKYEILMQYFLGEGWEDVLTFPQVYASVIDLIVLNKVEVDVSKFFNYNFEANRSFYYYSVPKVLLNLVNESAEDKEKLLLLLVLMIHCCEKRTNILIGYLLDIGDRINESENDKGYKERIVNLTYWIWKGLNENEDFEKFKGLLMERNLYISERDTIYRKLFMDYREREMDIIDHRIQEFLESNK